jgi:hypothetical protein
MIVRRPAVLALAFAALFTPARADDAPFLNTDPASTLAAGEMAVQQWFAWAAGHSGQSYRAFESLTEFDIGISDRLQLAATLVYDWDYTRPPGSPAATTSLAGFQGELVYVLAPADQSPVGVALAIDPVFNPASHGLAVRLLLTKFLWGFEHVLNINFENSWDKDGAGGWSESGAIVFNYGLGYALNPHWTVGLELGNQFTFSRLATSVNFRDPGSTLFLGPSLQYDGAPLVISLGVQAQLPLASGGDVVNGYRADAERWRASLRFSHSL